MASKRPTSHAERAESAKRESRYIDFKARFDPSETGEWVELVKDFAAMANSGGGAVVFGVGNDGRRSGADLEPIRKLDPAKITDKLSRYTGQHFSDFEVKEIKRGRAKAVVIEVGPVTDLLVFSKPGTYTRDPEKPKQQTTAFGRGTIYFRHGAKSEPAIAADIAAFIETRLDATREKWLGDIRRVITAPPGAEFTFFEQTASGAGGEPTEIRLTGDPSAPAFGKLDPDQTHPHLTNGMIQAVQDRLPDGRVFNSHDANCVRKIHKIEPDTKPEFIHIPKFGSPQYSDAYVDWLAEQPQEFFDDARVRFYEQTHT
jgi:hypothetical protein